MTRLPGLLAALSAACLALPALAEGNYDPGASDTEIKIGNTVPYSGPVSIYGLIGRTEAAYVGMINDGGGISGRKITFISYGDAYSPPKTVEQVRKLVESDEVLAIFGIIGSQTNASVIKYLNGKDVPQLFAGSGATKFGDPETYPWTIGWIPNYAIARPRSTPRRSWPRTPRPRWAIIHQNDDFGKDYLSGLKAGLGDRADQLVAIEPFETTEPTIDSHIVNLKASGADALVIAAIGKFASQTIRKAGELGWRPAMYVSNTAVAVNTVLKPAGLEFSTGVVSAAYRKDPSDPAWADDPEMKEFLAFMEEYLPGESPNDQAVFGYVAAQGLVRVLEQAGDELTRENLMRQAAALKDAHIDMILPGITVNTGPEDFFPIEQFQLMRFTGEHWERFGDVQGM